ncbi:substrate-binding periplasmic protein [Marinomonas algarum]|uniref:Transporter substrate-binding domain-containing protein n=1 Tax=Marinomonas algarum TaxID=2883105 RepID=A0A9X1IP32_9GAMM|nr:transporter substrate-binding domain-containing protein [Marinomonas algarum]MCB5162527.1 transporter substrate-binding domain-containing protein [Marinomonas algarum]
MRPIFATFITLLLSVSQAAASKPDAFGCGNSAISVGITNSGVMYNKGQGIDPDLLNLLSDITGCQFTLTPIMRNEAFDLLEQGKIDWVPSVGREPSRELFAWFIPYYDIRFLLLANTDRLPVITSLQQLKSLKNVTVARAQGGGYGYYFNYYLSEMASLGMIKLYPDYEASVAALLNDEVDATLSLPQVYRSFFTQGEEPSSIRITDVSPTKPVTVSFMLAKHRFSSSQSTNWLRIIEQIRLDGRFQEIVENYVSKDEAASMLGNTEY